MRLKSIQLKNFLSFKNVNIDIVKDFNEPPTIYTINGINYDNESNDNDSSNGSGKSAFIGESIMFNIYGRGLRGSKQKVKLNEMIKHGANEMFNSIEYYISENDEEQIFNIKRTKSEKGSTTEIFIDGEDKTKRLKRLSDNDIRLFVDLEPELFTQIVVYYKDNINLLSMNYGQRIDFFKKIINLELIDEYYESAKDFKNTNEKYITYLKQFRKSTANVIDIIDSNKDKYKDYIKEEKEKLELKLLDYDKVEFESTVEYDNKIKEINMSVSEIDKKIKNLNNNLIVNKRDIETIDKELKNITKLVGGKCPTCKQLVTDEYSNVIEKEYEKNKKKIIIDIEEKVKALDVLSDEKKKHKVLIDDLKEKINKIESEKMLHNQEVKAITNQINKYNIDLNSIRDDVDNSDKNKYERKLVGIDKALDIRNEWKTSIEYWFNLFSPKSLLRASIIRKYIVILSDIFEYYVSKLYNNEIVSKIEIDDDGNIDIILMKDRYETNYWQMSSGERKRIDVAMILSLYEFCSYIKPNIPKFLILDEIFDSLDAPGITAVIDTLIDVQNRHQIDIFIISHIAVPISNNMNGITVKNILVSKKDKESTVKILDEIEED